MAGKLNTAGWLALVATPIGNLDDMTYRAVQTLHAADLIAAEDTRRARKLLNRFEIQCSLTSYGVHNEHRKTGQLIGQVQAGAKLALLSDAGTPCLSDPGYLLVREALTCGIEPIVVPGVSALTFGVMAAGLPMHTFTFAGFLPPKSAKRRAALARLLAEERTFFLFESPHRVGKLLADLVAVGGGDAQVVLMREATKLHEECLRGTADELLPYVSDRTWKGEFTIAVHRGKS